MKTMSAARCNNNTHAVLKVDLLLESPMQGLHSESLWTGMLCGATTSPFEPQSYISPCNHKIRW